MDGLIYKCIQNRQVFYEADKNNMYSWISPNNFRVHLETEILSLYVGIYSRLNLFSVLSYTTLYIVHRKTYWFCK